MADGGDDHVRRPAASSKPRLNLNRIVSETLELIDEQGIALASMRTVAQRLKVRPMSLYRYVENREGLFDLVVERIVNQLNDDETVLDRADADWRAYLSSLAWGVRRYALAHPHAFPLVATRPPAAPWVNPPLRSLRWIESMLVSLGAAGFSDEQTLFTYRTFNSFLLGYLLLETSAMVIDDPKPGDGSFQSGDDSGQHDPVDPADPVPGSLSPTRTTAEREAIDAASEATDLIDTTEHDQAEEYPTIHRLRDGLTENRFEQEFEAGLDLMLTRIDAMMHDQSPGPATA